MIRVALCLFSGASAFSDRHAGSLDYNSPTNNIWDDEFLDTYVTKLNEPEGTETLETLNSEANFGYFLQRVKWHLETCTDENPMLVFLGRPWMLPKTSRLRVLWEGRQGTRKGFKTLLEHQGQLLIETEAAGKMLQRRFASADGGRVYSHDSKELYLPSPAELAEKKQMQDFLKRAVKGLVDEEFPRRHDSPKRPRASPQSNATSIRRDVPPSDNDKSSSRSALSASSMEENVDDVQKGAEAKPKTAAERKLQVSLRKFANALDETAAVLQEEYRFLRLASHTHIILGKRLLGVVGYFTEFCIRWGCPDDRSEIAARIDSIAQNYVQDATHILRGDLSRTDPRFWRALDETEKSLSINSTAQLTERRKYPNPNQQPDEGQEKATSSEDDEDDLIEDYDPDQSSLSSSSDERSNAASASVESLDSTFATASELSLSSAGDHGEEIGAESSSSPSISSRSVDGTRVRERKQRSKKGSGAHSGVAGGQARGRETATDFAKSIEGEDVSDEEEWIGEDGHPGSGGDGSERSRSIDPAGSGTGSLGEQIGEQNTRENVDERDTYQGGGRMVRRRGPRNNLNRVQNQLPRSFGKAQNCDDAAMCRNLGRADRNDSPAGFGSNGRVRVSDEGEVVDVDLDITVYSNGEDAASIGRSSNRVSVGVRDQHDRGRDDAEALRARSIEASLAASQPRSFGPLSDDLFPSDQRDSKCYRLQEVKHREYYENLPSKRGSEGPLASVYRAFDPKKTKENLLSDYMQRVLEFLDALTQYVLKDGNFHGTMLQLVQKISEAHCGLQYRLNAAASMFLTTHAIKPPTFFHPWSFDQRFTFEDRACCRRYHVLGKLIETLHAESGYRTLRGVEVGVNNAISSKYLLKFPYVNLTGLDPFIDVTESIQAMSYAVFDQYPERCQLLKVASEEFAQYVPDGSLDFVFIDGDHSFSGETFNSGYRRYGRVVSCLGMICSIPRSKASLRRSVCSRRTIRGFIIRSIFFSTGGSRSKQKRLNMIAALAVVEDSSHLRVLAEDTRCKPQRQGAGLHLRSLSV
eukprot:GSA25T00006024001.1